jgi:hypothetical protein
VEPLLFEYFGITAAERELIADTLDVFEPSIMPRSFHADVPTLAATTPEIRKGYADELCLTFNNLTRRSGFRINGRTVLSPSAGLAVVVFKKDSAAAAYTESTAEEDFSQALRRLAHAAPEHHGRFVHLRDIKLFQSDEIFIVKPLVRRAWSHTAALNDADEIAAAILSAR